jgi:hypothetical protein
MKDWYAAVADSVDVGAATLERVISGISGSSAPPWVTLPWPPKNTVDVRIRSPLGPNESATASPLCLLGEAAGGNKSLEVSVKPVSSYVLRLSMDPYAKAQPGEYLGFVFCGKNSTPAAVTHLTVPKDK